MRTVSIGVVLGLCAAALHHGAVAATRAPDVSASTISVAPSPVREGDVADFTVTLRNGGPDAIVGAQVTLEWPLMAFLVDVTGANAAVLDHVERRIAFAASLAPGAHQEVHVRVLAPRDSGGDVLTLTLSLRLFDGQLGIDHWDRASVTIDSVVSPSAFRLGGIGVTTAGVATLAVLGFGLLLWIALTVMAPRNGRGGSSRLFGPGAAAAAITIALGFWVMFAVMAMRDYRVLTAWRETSCTILGGRMSEVSTTTQTRVAGRSTPDTVFVPVLGLRYLVDGRETFSTGFDTGSHIRSRASRRAGDDLSAWTVGKAAPCWFDPANPTDVVVQRGFGLAYLFALLPLPVFLLGVWVARTSLRRV